jgi:hypothetical protein
VWIFDGRVHVHYSWGEWRRSRTGCVNVGQLRALGGERTSPRCAQMRTRSGLEVGDQCRMRALYTLTTSNQAAEIMKATFATMATEATYKPDSEPEIKTTAPIDSSR